jgi:uncharacterized membrane protein YGL010W
MRTFVDQLSTYAAYHRDRRNIATHFIGVPMIVFAVCILLSRPAFFIGGLALNPAWIVGAITCAFYLSLNVPWGLLMTALFVALIWAAGFFAASSTVAWLGWGIGLFVLGWAIQFVGHYYEGRKPAFVDDLIGLIIGPLFVTVEFVFLLGLGKNLKAQVEARVGPTHWGRGHEQAA